jgi:hypothetical protein
MHRRTVLVGVCLMALTMGCGERRPCGTEPGHGAAAAEYGVRRAGETVAAMQVLGLRWSADPHDTDNDPFARFAPALDVTAPPVPACAVRVEGTRWGPLGPPDELVEVPREMQEPDPERNLKWRAIARYASQVDCARRDDGSYHPSCG